jgi:thiamine-monophosphate kinase
MLVEAGVRCGMDISDGLAADVQKLCSASGVAAEVSLASVPTDPELSLVLGDTCKARALGGGEDFELLFTASPETMRRTQARLAAKSLARATVVGTIVPGNCGEITVRDEKGRVVPLSQHGFDHFGAASNSCAGE